MRRMGDELESEASTAGAGFSVLYKREPLPWVLFVATLVIFMVATVLLVNKVNGAERRWSAAITAQETAEASVRTARAEADQARARVAELETQLKAVITQREALAERVKALEAAKTEVKKPAAKPAPPVKKKKKR